jgi:hypothetical protein
MKSIAPATIFFERDQAVYYVTNWKIRESEPAISAKIILLSAQHLKEYRKLKAKGSSQRSIWDKLFGKFSKVKLAAIPPTSIFVERDTTVYLVTNWQIRRKSPIVKPKIIKLSAHHLQLYRDMKEKGRSQQIIYRHVFDQASSVEAPSLSAPNPKAPSVNVLSADVSADVCADVSVDVPLSLLNADQLISLIGTRMSRTMPSLRELPLVDLRRLCQALCGKASTDAPNQPGVKRK